LAEFCATPPGHAIADVHRRCVTLRELLLMCDLVRRRCAAECWMGRVGASAAPVRLTPETVNMYHINELVLKPTTEARACSFVELTVAEQRTCDVFLSHAWAHPFLLTVAVIDQYARDRELGADTRVWICLFALRQNDPGAEIPDSIPRSPFFLAIKEAKLVLIVLGERLELLGRLWCGLEAHVSLVEGAGSLLTDIYTGRWEGTHPDHRCAACAQSPIAGARYTDGGLRSHYSLCEGCVENEGAKAGAPGSAARAAFDDSLERIEAPAAVHGLTDGFLPREDGAPNYKLIREMQFPLELVHAAMRFSLAAADAAMPRDKETIMRYVEASEGGAAAVDATVRARASASALPMLAKQLFADLSAGFAALRLSQLPRLQLNLGAGATSGGDHRLTLARSLPRTLRELTIWNSGMSDAHAAAIGEHLASITTLTLLNLGHNGIGDAGAAALAAGLGANTSLTALDLGTTRIGDAGAACLAESLEGHASLALLSFGWTEIGDAGAACLSESLMDSPSLASLNLGYTAIGDAGAACLCESLAGGTSLTRLDLRGRSENQLSEEARAAIRAAWLSDGEVGGAARSLEGLLL
jgi:hypothetical protein